MNPTASSSSENGLQSLIRSIDRFSESDEVNKAAIIQHMKTYISNVDDWFEFAKFREDTYTRNLVSGENEKYNIIIMAWKPRQSSSLHDHSSSSCFVKILSGTLCEIRYETPKEDGSCAPIGKYTRKRDDVLYIDSSIGVHMMKNTSSEPAVSLHVYIPPLHMYNAFDPSRGLKEAREMIYNTPEEEEEIKPTID